LYSRDCKACGERQISCISCFNCRIREDFGLENENKRELNWGSYLGRENTVRLRVRHY